MEVTMVKRSEYPLEEVYGKEVGSYIKDLLKQNNVLFLGNSKIEDIQTIGDVHLVNLSNGEQIESDFIFYALGDEQKEQSVKESNLDLT